MWSLAFETVNCGQPRWSPAWICSEGKAECCVDPKWRLFRPVWKRYPPTAPTPIRKLVSFPKHFRPECPHIEAKGRSGTARMGWRRGLNRNKIWSFDGLHSPKQVYRCTNGAIKVRSSCRWWNSYAVNEISWIFYCFFFGRLFFGLHGPNKLALASILVSCDGRRECMRMSSDLSILNRRQQLGASSRKHRGVDWALKIQLTIWISGNSDRGKLHLLFQRVNNKQTDYCCPNGYLGLICVATMVNLQYIHLYKHF